MPQQPIVYLIDGSAYFYRAFHAIPALANAAGLPTNAAYGFTNILLRVLREKEAEYAVVAYDARGPGFRHEIYPDYKATRKAMPDDLAVQIPYIKKLVAAHHIASLEMEGMEADDLIATAARKLAAAGCRVVVVSGDKDLLQLVNDDNIVMWDPMRDVVMDGQWVRQKYQVAPEQLLDFFALTGDTSDNVPGVAGIGPKTAEKLINEFGSLEQLYDRLAELSRKPLREKLAAHRAEADLSKRLIRLREDLEVPADIRAYRRGEPDRQALRELYAELEFSRLLEGVIDTAAVDGSGFVLVRDQATLAAALAELAKAPFLVIDTETTSLDPLAAELVGISLCGGPERAWYLPLAHRDGEGRLLEGQLDRQAVVAALKPLLAEAGRPKIGHNLKFDYSMLAACCDLRMAGPLWDTMIAAYLLDPARRSYKLDDLCKMHLGLQLTTFAEATADDKRPEAFAYVAPEAARDYSCEDVVAAAGLWEGFRAELEGRDQWQLFSDLESGLIPILAEMELAGIRLDPEQLRILSEEFAAALATLEEEIHRLAGQEFNINSPRQLGEILFEKLKLPHGRKTKTGYSTDIGVLEKLSFHELPRAMITHRNLTKLKTTYVDKLASLIHPATGRVHTSFNQTVTATGRLSSSNPNLQNIPIRTEEGQRIRRAFIPAPGHLFLAGDYSQIDLRVLAHYSGDEALLAAFRSGQDIHSRTAAEIFMVSPLLITSQMRRVAKTINFGIVYGMSSFGLAEQLHLSRRQAQDFIDRYFAHYTGVKRFMTDIVARARQEGQVTTLFNRRRVLPEINSSNKGRREFAERTAINTPIQGTAADIIKLAMLRVHERLGREGLQSRLLLQIHDELVFEVPEAELEAMQSLVKETMEGVAALEVPLVVNLKAGGNLAEV